MADLLRETRVAEVHFSASRREPPRMRSVSALWHDARHVTCVDRVRATVGAAREAAHTP